MKRFLSTAGRPARPANGINRRGVKVSQNAHNSNLEKADGLEHTVNFMLRHASVAQGEDFGGLASTTPQRLEIDRRRERSPAAANVRETTRAAEPNGPGADGAQAEVKRMAQAVLKAGGEEIVGRLKEADAQAAAEKCTRPEIGGLIEAYYVPLLLSALELSDKEFEAEYPGEGRVTAAQRAALAEAIDAHAYDCPRCLIKASGDWEWYHHVHEVSARNGESHRYKEKP